MRRITDENPLHNTIYNKSISIYENYQEDISYCTFLYKEYMIEVTPINNYINDYIIHDEERLFLLLMQS